MDFYITDVFGQEKYTGNQLATFLHCGDVSDREMQLKVNGRNAGGKR